MIELIWNSIFFSFFFNPIGCVSGNVCAHKLDIYGVWSAAAFIVPLVHKLNQHFCFALLMMKVKATLWRTGINVGLEHTGMWGKCGAHLQTRAHTHRVIRTALSWWAIPFSGILLPSLCWARMDFCHLQKLSRDLSAWWLISRFGCKIKVIRTLLSIFENSGNCFTKKKGAWKRESRK